MPNAENCTLAELEIAWKAAPTLKAHNRFGCIRALLLGHNKDAVCTLFCVNLNTLNGWIRRFNASGIDGLIDRKQPGRPPTKIPVHLEPELEAVVSRPAEVGVTHWTGKKFHGYLTEQLELEVGYRTAMRWLQEHDFVLKVPRPWPDRQEPVLRAQFQFRLAKWLADEEIELWYLDEMGVEGDPRPRRRWAKVGEKLTVTHNGEHVRMNVTGTICPRTGVFYGLEFTHTDTDVFQCFLDHANKDLQFSRKRNLLIMDNATWHKSKSLKFGHFEPVFLPPYSPDYNPIERLWLILKEEWFADFYADDRESLIARLDLALQWLINRTAQNQVTAAIC